MVTKENNMVWIMNKRNWNIEAELHAETHRLVSLLIFRPRSYYWSEPDENHKGRWASERVPHEEILIDEDDTHDDAYDESLSSWQRKFEGELTAVSGIIYRNPHDIVKRKHLKEFVLLP